MGWRSARQRRMWNFLRLHERQKTAGPIVSCIEGTKSRCVLEYWSFLPARVCNGAFKLRGHPWQDADSRKKMTFKNGSKYEFNLDKQSLTCSLFSEAADRDWSGGTLYLGGGTAFTPDPDQTLSFLHWQKKVTEDFCKWREQTIEFYMLLMSLTEYGQIGQWYFILISASHIQCK